MSKTIILASTSPRRKQLLAEIGVSFSACGADVDETLLPHETPEKYAVRVALEKALAVKERASGVIIGADTIVVLGDTVLGKPLDAEDAVRMLLLLSGNMHRVITALAIVEGKKTLTNLAETSVWFRELSPQEIKAYVRSGEPLDKAGAYGIQGKGALFVPKIEGCYFNVVGLPLSLLANMLREFGIDLLT